MLDFIHPSYIGYSKRGLYLGLSSIPFRLPARCSLHSDHWAAVTQRGAGSGQQLAFPTPPVVNRRTWTLNSALTTPLLPGLVPTEAHGSLYFTFISRWWRWASARNWITTTCRVALDGVKGSMQLQRHLPLQSASPLRNSQRIPCQHPGCSDVI